MPRPSSPVADGQCTQAQGPHRQLSTPPSRSNLPIPPPATGEFPAVSPTYPSPSPATSQRRDWPLSTESSTLAQLQSPLRQSLSCAEEPAPAPATMPLTGDPEADTPPEVSSQQGRSGAWYTRRSRPVTGDAHATPTKVRAVPPALATPASPGRPKLLSPSAASRFPFFASSISALRGLTSTLAATPQDDELVHLDIEAALFPPGTPADGDGSSSPAAFKNLHANATSLLRRFQTAYQQRTVAFDELRAEREAQDDERSEIETRTRHLKMQLEGMAQKAAENEAIMKALMEELNREKKLRMEHQQAREKEAISSNRSTVSEDLCAEEDQRSSDRRRSGETAKSDLSSDTDEDSIEEASVFSRSRSPALTAGALDVSPLENTSQPPPPQYTRLTVLGSPRAPRQPPPQMSTFQKLFKGMSSEAPRDDDPRSVYSCHNCQGQDASVAWDTASLLRDENRGLKRRVGELEAAVEEALDAVIGIGL